MKDLTPSIKVDQKVEAFRIALFPQLPPVNLSDTSSFQYPEQIELPPITAQEIQEAVRGAKLTSSSSSGPSPRTKGFRWALGRSPTSFRGNFPRHTENPCLPGFLQLLPQIHPKLLTDCPPLGIPLETQPPPSHAYPLTWPSRPILQVRSIRRSRLARPTGMLVVGQPEHCRQATEALASMT